MHTFKRLASTFTKRIAQPSVMPAGPSRLRRALNPWGALRAERQAAEIYMSLASQVVEVSAEREETLDRYRTAVCDFATLFDDGMLACHIAEKLTCSEAEGLADFFRAVDHPHVADLWLECHREGDGENDLHYMGERITPTDLAIAA
ncbi:hypothetical protein ACH427_21135 [Streptomyces sp. NPDC020379]|uniref:hypothetical protein n=1 Tax=Streptomyces sp. NPDC020379 TaxID=3365071 RepID=UPI0037B85A7C